MKKLILLIAVVLTTTFQSWAQPTITLLTFEGYTFADEFDVEYTNGSGSGKIQDGFQWGAGLEFGLSETTAVEIYYQNLQTEAVFRGFTGLEYTGNVGINYAMIGGTRYAPLKDKISGFGSFDLGAAWINPDESLDSESVTKFAIGARLGVRFQANEKVSIRLHGQLLSPVQWAGGGFYFGTGGSGAGVSTGSTIWQFNLGGSLNYRLK